MARLALVIEASAFHLYRVRRGEATEAGRAADRGALEKLLAQQTQPGDEVFLYTDLIDESYLRSELPPLWIASVRAQLLARRLEQQLGHSPYRAVVVPRGAGLGPPRVATLIGLPEVDGVRAAIDAVQARGLRLGGMWPLSLLLGRLAGAARRGAPVLLSMQLPSGWRHVLVVEGDAVFSRLSPRHLVATADDELPDARRTAQYLVDQGWIARGPLATHFWIDQTVAEPPADSAPELDIRSWEPAGDLYRRALCERPPARGQLLPSAETLAWRAARLGRLALASCLAAFIGTAGWAAWAEWRVQELQDRTVAMEAQALGAEGRTSAILATARGNLAQAGLAQSAVQAWSRLVRDQPDVDRVLNALAGALASVPDLQPVRIAWRAGEVRQGAASGAGAGTLCAEATGTVPAPPASAASAATRTNALVLRIAARLPAQLGLRARLQAQEQAQAALRALGWDVRLTKPAVDLSSSASSAGTLGEANASELELCVVAAAP